MIYVFIVVALAIWYFYDEHKRKVHADEFLRKHNIDPSKSYVKTQQPKPKPYVKSDLERERSIATAIDSGTYTNSDTLKMKGDLYERKVGRYLEQKGFGVCQHGFKKDRADEGIDLIAVSPSDKTILFVQCKNWTQKTLTLELLDQVSEKLLRGAGVIPIQNYIDSLPLVIAQDLHGNFHTYRKEYFLCIASENVVDLAIGKYLKMSGQSFYVYDDKLKIVVV